MKKLFLLIVFLLSAQIMFGQFDLGLKAGYNASKLSTDLDTVTASFGSGFHVGAFARIGKKFYLQPEVYYTLQTSTFTGVANLDEKITIGSMDVPVLVGFKFLNTKATKIRLMAGPVASFVVNRNVKELSDNPDPLQVTEADINNVNWALQVGGGLDVFMLSLDVRYQVGLNEVINEVQTATWNSKNNVWVVSLGLKLL